MVARASQSRWIQDNGIESLVRIQLSRKGIKEISLLPSNSTFQLVQAGMPSGGFKSPLAAIHRDDFRRLAMLCDGKREAPHIATHIQYSGIRLSPTCSGKSIIPLIQIRPCLLSFLQVNMPLKSVLFHQDRFFGRLAK
jgi:hypothetical protein